MVLSNGASPSVGWASVSRADFSITLAHTALELSTFSSAVWVGEGEGGKRDCSGIFPEAGVFVGRSHVEPPASLPRSSPEDISLCLLVVHSVGVEKGFFHLLLYIHLK